MVAMTADALTFLEELTIRVVFIIIMVPVSLLLGWYAARRRDPRAKALAEWAKQRDMVYRRKRHKILDRDRFQCLSRGSNQYATNRIGGTYHGWAMEAFDYSYIAPRRDYARSMFRNSGTRSFGAVMVRSLCPLQPLVIRPVDTLHTLRKIVGRDDIDFELPAFNDRFVVESPNRQWAYDVVHQDAMRFLMEYAGDFSFEFGEGAAIIWRESILSPEEIHQAFAVLTSFLHLLLGYVVEDQSRPGVPPLSGSLS
jgi:hypothetical protein